MVPWLAMIFLVWGALTGESSLFVPGGIFAGIGLGAVLIAGPFAGDGIDGAVFMLAFAAGWLLIPIFSFVFSDERHLWALVPAVILGLVGAGLLQGGMALQLLQLMGRVWPLFLILAGILVLWRQSP